jgi:hypothetical protein
VLLRKSMDRMALRTKVTRCYHQSSSRHAVLPPVNRRVSWLPALWPCHRRRCCHGAGPSSSSITAAMPTPSSAQRNQQPTNASNTASLCQSFLYILIITRQILYGRPPITILLCTMPILYEHHHKAQLRPLHQPIHSTINAQNTYNRHRM